MSSTGLSSLRRLKCGVRELQRKLHQTLGSVSSTELLFQSMFNHAVGDRSAGATFYPVGSAANYSLLYIVHRVLTETDVTSALDIGAGQTTILFDLLRRRLERPLAVTTVESDVGWAGRIQTRVEHRVLRTDLVRREVRGHSCNTYAEWPSGRFDFVVVDGPNMARRRSRWGVLNVLENQLNTDFVVVFDDATRAGELDTISAFLRENDRVAGFRFLHGGKSQCVVYSAKYAWLQNLY